MEEEREDKKIESAAEEAQSTSAFTKRRKILTGAPALLLLANRPAFAGTCSISGFMSAKVGTSLATHDPGLCDGWSPGNWKNNSGQITSSAWDTAAVSHGQSFSSLFNTTNMGFGNGHIREVNNGTPGNFITYSSGISLPMLDVIEGAIQGGNNEGSIVKHAAATYLNAAFLANGGGGTQPDPWMVNYISPTDVIGLYLLYELTFLRTTPLPAGLTYRYERSGSVIAGSQNMTSNEYNSFFVNLSNGSGSQTWQDG